MKLKKIYIFIILAGLISTECEDVLNSGNSTSIVQQLEGIWKCDENSTIFKSTKDIYSVYISPSNVDSTEIFIENFYALGNDTEALATVSGNSISLPQQTLPGGYVVRGNGTISSNLKEISWKYYVDDGSGQVDEVNATYTFQY
jgi:hypothetical protein